MSKQKKYSILLVEDDKLTSITMADSLKKYGRVECAFTKDEALYLNEINRFDIAFIDLDLEKKLEGLDVLKALKNSLYTVILTGREEDNIISDSYEIGCNKYIAKPFDIRTIDAIFKELSLKGVDLAKDFSTSIEIKEKIEDCARSFINNIPVHLRGETGTGKTRLAYKIHEYFGCGNFVNINCSEFSETILESELFGHVKGAFTGALSDKKGVFERANGGTLFLDEVGTMSSSIQKKVLKVIEEKSFTRVGCSKTLKIEFKLITATCEDLEKMILQKKFREDLFYRINGLSFTLPPLRERNEDIELIIKRYLKNNKKKIILKQCAIEELKRREWKGNVRELIRELDILIGKQQGIFYKKDLMKSSIPVQIPNVDDLDLDLVTSKGLKKYIEELESLIVNSVYKRNDKKMRKTLRDLKMSNSSFYRIMGEGDYSGK